MDDKTHFSDLYPEERLTSTTSHRGFFTPFSVIIMMAAFLMIAVVGWGIYQNNLSQPKEGTAPDFSLLLIGNNGNFSLAEQHGYVVVINFWGSWCAPCREEAPMLQRTYDYYQDQGVVFVGIAVKDIESDSLAYLDEFNITYPNVMDIGGEMEKAYRIQGVPETFVINRQGEIIKFFYAQPSELELRAAIEQALQKS